MSLPRSSAAGGQEASGVSCTHSSRVLILGRSSSSGSCQAVLALGPILMQGTRLMELPAGGENLGVASCRMGATGICVFVQDGSQEYVSLCRMRARNMCLCAGWEPGIHVLQDGSRVLCRMEARNMCLCVLLKQTYCLRHCVCPVTFTRLTATRSAWQHSGGRRVCLTLQMQNYV